ncbi:S49 family peptidase [Labrys portucalensis]|uniref:S49 family peptidase n=1 Tax=Labrys neptuniae TaxID=376174 RepID=A0ABV6ZJZ1_9HYPH
MTNPLATIAAALPEALAALAAPVSAVSWPAALTAEPMLVLDARAEDVRVAFHAADVAQRSGALNATTAPRYQAQSGRAVIPVTGSLLNRGDVDGGRYGFTSYGWLAAAFDAAAADNAVTEVVLALDSPGGTVSGIEAATESLQALAASKHVIAHVDGLAASAAYWLASQAHEIVMTPMSQVGSIGVYTTHVDFSKLLDNIGVKVSLIASGRHKVEGNPFEALPPEARAAIQEHIDDLRLTFAQMVAAGRGDRLTADQAMATEARVYRGRHATQGKTDAVAAGLADRLASKAQLFASPARNRRAQPKGSQMSDQNQQTGDNKAGITQEQLAAAQATSRSEGEKAGADAATTRISSILGSEAAKSRATLANHLAFKTDMSAEQALATLAASPEEKQGSRLDGRVPDPKLNGNTQGGTKTAKPIDIDAIYSQRNKR